MDLFVYGPGAGALAVLWVLYRLLAGTWSFWRLVEGADGRGSASKAQWLLWTIVAFFSYSAIYAARLERGHPEAIADIPANLLVAMGLSIGTATLAKVVTSTYVNEGRTTESNIDPSTPPKELSDSERKTRGLGGIFLDDDGYPALNKIQMMGWTLIAVVVYIVQVTRMVVDTTPRLPDIDLSLIVLMGMGQAAYLSKKLVTTDSAPRIAGLWPASGPPGTTIKIFGSLFGTGQKEEGSQIIIDGTPVGVGSQATWQDDQITFTFPSKRPDDTPWKSGELVKVAVKVDSRVSTGDYTFTVAAAEPSAVGGNGRCAQPAPTAPPPSPQG